MIPVQNPDPVTPPVGEDGRPSKLLQSVQGLREELQLLYMETEFAGTRAEETTLDAHNVTDVQQARTADNRVLLDVRVAGVRRSAAGA